MKRMPAGQAWIEAGWSLALTLALPGAAVGGWLVRHGIGDISSGRAVGLACVFLLPVIVLPGLARARRNALGEARLLRDLGASRMARWRLLWGPVYAPRLLLGIGLAALWLGAAALAPPLSRWLPAQFLHPHPPRPL
ncbi:hypothetical protein [Endobacter medicaginis]|nr:hypothetical protein [Endobacter medicaginis]MCX5475815.1 hypothetical protein [Endobacter medicaginis]